MMLASNVVVDFSSSSPLQRHKSESNAVMSIFESDAIYLFLLNTHSSRQSQSDGNSTRDVVDFIRDCGHIELLNVRSFKLDLDKQGEKINLVSDGPDVQFGACADSLNSLLLFAQSPLVSYLLSSSSSPPAPLRSKRPGSRRDGRPKATRMEAQEEEEEEDWEAVHTGDVEEKMLRENVVRLSFLSSSPSPRPSYHVEEEYLSRDNLRRRRRERREIHRGDSLAACR
mmetsp:Transcript_18750/g.43048  ORF Transcript_18750/g.43048 Transcript_18750/m.43048 type:complete len:227 (-) Transcript_18750:2602-3282(-)